MKPIILARETTFANPVLLADGIGSSGKRLLAHIAGMVEGVEKLTHNPWYESIATLHWIGDLSAASAVAMLRTEADRHTYHLSLGREVNLRRGESTSIFSNSRPLRYVSRMLFQQEREPTVKSIYRHRPIINEGTHDGLRSGPLFEMAFGDRLYFLHVFRHPADLALDWLRRRREQIGTNPQMFAPLVLRQGRIEPLYMLGEDSGVHSELDSGEQVLAMLAFCFEQNLAGLRSMSSPDRVRLYSFEEVIAGPDSLLRDIEDLTGRTRVGSPKRLFRKEGVPRTPASSAHQESELASHLSSRASQYYERCLAAHHEFMRLRTPLLGS